MAFSHDSHPYVGRDETAMDKSGTEDVLEKWVIGGFHGHGMVRIFLSAKALVMRFWGEEWPEWFPYGYRYHGERHDMGEVEEFLESH